MERIEKLLPIGSVCESTGMRRSYIYDHMQKGDFPRSVRIGPRSVRWKLSDVQRWIAERSQAASPTYQ